MDRYDNQTFDNYHNKKSAENKLDRLTKAKIRIEEFLQHKKQFKDGRKNQGNLEK
jgi:cell fate (sporulation/competence/biofilm development) regulator YlbF (YheA/YmcA/DUF963 family)